MEVRANYHLSFMRIKVSELVSMSGITDDEPVIEVAQRKPQEDFLAHEVETSVDDNETLTGNSATAELNSAKEANNDDYESFSIEEVHEIPSDDSDENVRETFNSTQAVAPHSQNNDMIFEHSFPEEESKPVAIFDSLHPSFFNDTAGASQNVEGKEKAPEKPKPKPVQEHENKATNEKQKSSSSAPLHSQTATKPPSKSAERTSVHTKLESRHPSSASWNSSFRGYSRYPPRLPFIPASNIIPPPFARDPRHNPSQKYYRQIPPRRVSPSRYSPNQSPPRQSPRGRSPANPPSPRIRVSTNSDRKVFISDSSSDGSIKITSTFKDEEDPGIKVHLKVSPKKTAEIQDRFANPVPPPGVAFNFKSLETTTKPSIYDVFDPFGSAEPPNLSSKPKSKISPPRGRSGSRTPKNSPRRKQSRERDRTERRCSPQRKSVSPPTRTSSASYDSVRKSPGRRSPTRRSSARGSPDHKSPLREHRSPGRRSPTRRSPARGSPDRRTPLRAYRSPGRRSPTRRSPERGPDRRSPSRRSPARRSPPRDLRSVDVRPVSPRRATPRESPLRYRETNTSRPQATRSPPREASSRAKSPPNSQSGRGPVPRGRRSTYPSQDQKREAYNSKKRERSRTPEGQKSKRPRISADSKPDSQASSETTTTGLSKESLVSVIQLLIQHSAQDSSLAQLVQNITQKQNEDQQKQLLVKLIQTLAPANNSSNTNTNFNPPLNLTQNNPTNPTFSSSGGPQNPNFSALERLKKLLPQLLLSTSSIGSAQTGLNSIPSISSSPSPSLSISASNQPPPVTLATIFANKLMGVDQKNFPLQLPLIQSEKDPNQFQQIKAPHIPFNGGAQLPFPQNQNTSQPIFDQREYMSQSRGILPVPLSGYASSVPKQSSLSVQSHAFATVPNTAANPQKTPAQVPPQVPPKISTLFSPHITAQVPPPPSSTTPIPPPPPPQIPTQTDPHYPQYSQPYSQYAPQYPPQYPPQYSQPYYSGYPYAYHSQYSGPPYYPYPNSSSSTSSSFLPSEKNRKNNDPSARYPFE